MKIWFTMWYAKYSDIRYCTATVAYMKEKISSHKWKSVFFSLYICCQLVENPIRKKLDNKKIIKLNF